LSILSELEFFFEMTKEKTRKKTYTGKEGKRERGKEGMFRRAGGKKMG